MTTPARHNLAALANGLEIQTPSGPARIEAAPALPHSGLDVELVVRFGPGPEHVLHYLGPHAQRDVVLALASEVRRWRNLVIKRIATEEAEREAGAKEPPG